MWPAGFLGGGGGGDSSATPSRGEDDAAALDAVLARSLATAEEDEVRRRRAAEEEDAALARRLASEWGSASPAERPAPSPSSPAPLSSASPPLPPWQTPGGGGSPRGPGPGTGCGGCGRPVGPEGILDAVFGSGGASVTAMGRQWHAGCFRCAGCGEALADARTGAATFAVHQGKPMHEACFRERHHPRCCVCGEHIPAGADGMIRYHSLPFWGLQVCPRHVRGGAEAKPLLCTACGRPGSSSSSSSSSAAGAAGEGLVDLGDGRSCCQVCVAFAVFDTAEAMPLFAKVNAFFGHLGLAPATQEQGGRIPLLLVDSPSLNEQHRAAAAGHGHAREPGAWGDHADHQVYSHTRGLCLAEAGEIQTVVRSPGPTPLGGGFLGSPAWTRRVVRVQEVREVSAILVLFGLPRDLTSSILAHELMHAYLRLHKGMPRTLDHQAEEGLCQLMAFLWLEQGVPLLDPDADAGLDAALGGVRDQLRAYFRFQITTDPSHAYGEGFRKASRAFHAWGLDAVLDYVAHHATLPDVPVDPHLQH